MSEKRTFAEVVEEARAQIQRWPDSMKKLEEFRRQEMRKLDEARLADSEDFSSRK